MCTGFEWVPALFETTAVVEGAAALGAAELGATAIGAGLADAGLASSLVAGGSFAGEAALGAGLFEGAGIMAGLDAGLVGAGLGTGASVGASLMEGAGAFAPSWGMEGIGGGVGSGFQTEGILEGLGEGSANIGGGSGGVAGLSGLQAESVMASLGEGAVNIGGGPSSFLDSAWGAFQKYGQPAMSAHSALTGLQRAEEMRRMAKMAQKNADPWGASGGRSLADRQLQELLSDPSKVATNDPAFKLRVMGAQRANAQYGQDSGQMSIAGANASTDWYNARLAQLAGLSGAGVNPGQSSQLALGGLGSAAELESSALASLGYAGAGLGGTKGGLTPGQQQRLIELALGRGG